MKTKYFVGCLVVLSACSLIFQNCSPLKSQNTNSAFDLNIVEQADKSAKITYSKYSGTVSPENQYTLNYEIIVATKSFKLSVNKGAAVTDAPAPVSKTISDSQVAQIKSLLSKIKASSCKTGEMSLGGQSESIGIFSTSTRTSPETVVYGSDCTGLSSSFYQANSGFTELTTFLKTL